MSEPADVNPAVALTTEVWVRVRFNQAGEDAVSIDVDNLGIRAAKGEDLFPATDRRDDVPRDCYGLCFGLVRIHGDHGATQKD